MATATYVLLANFTDQGIRTVKETTRRADAFRELAKSFGITVKDIFWTLGRYDIVCIVEAPDDVSMTTLGLALGKSGNLRTETLRAFSQADIGTIVGKLA